MLESVTISAPSRLHFGLFSIGDIVQRKFGGVGLMLDSPRVVVRATQSDLFSVAGPCAKAVTESVQIWFKHQQIVLERELNLNAPDKLPVSLAVESIPPRHSGLGSGTQLAFATALAITRLLELPSPSVDELANSLGRGLRSGIGSHGFVRGGFLVDRGKLESESLAPLDFQTDFPDCWSIVTIIPAGKSGLSGKNELDAFKQLPDSTESERSEMIEIVRDRIIPGVTQINYDLFAEGVYEFGRRSGMMFATIQDGPFNGSHVGNVVRQVREFGVPAVGQSSWGPCVFAITRNDEEAIQLKQHLSSQPEFAGEVRISKADNQGARTIATDSELQSGTNARQF